MKLPQKGFSLIEVLVLTTVGILAGGLLVAILVNNTGVVYHQTSRVSQGLNINDALIKIRSLVKESSAVASEYPEGSSTPDYQTSNSQLVLKMNVIDSQGSVVADVFDYAIFFKDENRLRMIIFADPQSIKGSEDMVLAKQVLSINFDYLDDEGVNVSPSTLAQKVKATIVLQEKAGYSLETGVATSEASLRND
ncbi:MAG: hypothetical protein Q8P92_03395 [Candidatus Daviesbacteria bacterium]|nr:hypothetical protein [Candidatus Daviesbacteria bacterium]